VILVDANLLIYAYNTASPEHAVAREWLEATIAQAEPVALPWSVIFAFLRIITNQKILPQPLTIDEAISIVDEWLTLPTMTLVDRSSHHWSIARRVLQQSQVHGPLVTDAELAALAIEHDATVFTADRDFARFTGLRVINPLAS
jgi:uncharacterized protein